MFKFVDEYEIRARLLPAFIALAPAVLAPYTMFPDSRSVWGAFIGLLGGLGLSAALARFSRALGKRREGELFRSWGGAPATAMLRHSDGRLGSVSKEKMHDALRNTAPRFQIPTAAEEAADPKMADDIFDATVDWLRRQTRSKTDYPLVFAENVSYGFMRNLFGLKPLGIAVSASAIIVEALAMYLTTELEMDANSILVAVTLLIQFVILIYWIFHVTPSAVRVPAEGYARALLECCWDYAK